MISKQRCRRRRTRPLARFSAGAVAKAELARFGRFYATESMLLWDETAQAYDAEATPETGTETLADFCARVLEAGSPVRSWALRSCSATSGSALRAARTETLPC